MAIQTPSPFQRGWFNLGFAGRPLAAAAATIVLCTSGSFGNGSTPSETTDAAWEPGDACLSACATPASRPQPSGQTNDQPGLGDGDAGVGRQREKAESKSASGEARRRAGGGETSRVAPDAPAAELDAAEFFDRLVRRYRGLHTYRDTAKLVHVTQRDGHEAARVETEIGCAFRDGNLVITTPGSQAREALRLALPMRASTAVDTANRGYDFWLAPHMALKFDDDPLKHFRAGVEEGFTATDAETVTINDRPMVHLELRSGDGLSEDCEARFDIFVNPRTMLVECISGEQRLPDGGSSITTMHISPQESEGGEPTMMQ
jgi:hypothetical protein